MMLFLFVLGCPCSHPYKLFQDSPVQKKPPKKEKSHFDNLRDGPVHMAVHNKNSPITRECIKLFLSEL